MSSEKLDLSKYCFSCGNEVDRGLCHCGSDEKSHAGMELGHSFVPMGCSCGYAHGPTLEAEAAKSKRLARLLRRVVVELGRLEGVQRQRNEATAVLGDFLKERNLEWLNELLQDRGGVVRLLGQQCTCSSIPFPGYHDRTCKRGSILRLLGGEAEVKRQRDAAHEFAVSWPHAARLHVEALRSNVSHYALMTMAPTSVITVNCLICGSPHHVTANHVP